MNGENQGQFEYGEINLLDYVRIISKQKGFILAVFLVVVAAATVFTMLSPKSYKVETLIDQGVINGGTAEGAEKTAEKIKADFYGIQVRESLNIPEKYYPKIMVKNIKSTNLISITIEGKDIESAENVLSKLNDLISKDQDVKISRQKDILEKSVKTLLGDIEISKNNIERINVKINSLEKEKEALAAKVEAIQKVLPFDQDPGTQFALFDAKENLEAKRQEIENLYLEINSTNNQINSTKAGIDALNKQIQEIQSLKIIKSPAALDGPIKPRPVLNIGIAIVLGLFLGACLAFIKEWWKKATK